MSENTLVVLGTGGTISGRASSGHDNVGYVAGEVGVADLLDGVRAASAHAPSLRTRLLEAEQVAQVDSKDMGPAVWRPLLQRIAHNLARPDVKGIVVTHGTDTLEETAWLIQLALAPTKPVVMACAMRPATALVPDGPQNLLDALCVAAEPGAQGVVAVCAGTVHAAAHVQKVHCYQTDAFDSGDAGPLGCVEEGVLTAWQQWPMPDDLAASARERRLRRLLDAADWPRVEVVLSHAGADGAVVRLLLAAAGPSSGAAAPLAGLVVAGTGNGTVHADLLAALLEAQAMGVAVRRGTRCARGRVLSAPDAALPDTAGLSPVKARLSLIWDLLDA